MSNMSMIANFDLFWCSCKVDWISLSGFYCKYGFVNGEHRCFQGRQYYSNADIKDVKAVWGCYGHSPKSIPYTKYICNPNDYLATCQINSSFINLWCQGPSFRCWQKKPYSKNVLQSQFRVYALHILEVFLLFFSSVKCYLFLHIVQNSLILPINSSGKLKLISSIHYYCFIRR